MAIASLSDISGVMLLTVFLLLPGSLLHEWQPHTLDILTALAGVPAFASISAIAGFVAAVSCILTFLN